MTERPPIYVTRPDLPPLEEVTALLEGVWDRRILTNRGPLVQQLEDRLCDYLGVEHLSLVANATMGCILSLHHAGKGGEVITTPFSFVATAHAIRWAGADPVFVDIRPDDLTLDPALVEARINEKTRAIFAVHCHGLRCDVEALDDIGRRHNIPVVYDAAHVFGVRHQGQSLLTWGDYSVVSFHATKIFNTLEGGAVICRDRETKLAIDRLANYGIVDEATIDDVGFNAKMNEVNAAVGLALLNHIDGAIDRREQLSRQYFKALRSVPGIRCLCDPDTEGHNFYSFPILVGDDFPLSCVELSEVLRANDIIPRRYFYPLLSDLPMYRDLPSADPTGLENARQAADQILCLPLYPDLPSKVVATIADLIAGVVRR